MTDVLMLAIVVAFFAVAVMFVKACELIIGPDIEAAHVDTGLPAAADEEEAAA